SSTVCMNRLRLFLYVYYLQPQILPGEWVESLLHQTRFFGRHLSGGRISAVYRRQVFLVHLRHHPTSSPNLRPGAGFPEVPQGTPLPLSACCPSSASRVPAG